MTEEGQKPRPQISKLLHRGVTPGSMEILAKYPRLALRGRVYWFRAKVPVDLREHYAPKREITFSLKTRDYRTAVRRVQEESVRVDREFDDIRRHLGQPVSIALSDAEISRLTAAYTHARLAEDDAFRLGGSGDDTVLHNVASQIAEAGGVTAWRPEDLDRTGGGLTERDYSKAAEAYGLLLTTERHGLARGKLDMVSMLVDELLDEHGMKLDKRSLSYRDLSLAILKADIGVNEALSKRHEGQVVETPPPPPPPEQAVTTNEGDPTLMALFDLWCLERKPPKKTENDFRAALRRFVQVNGDLPVTKITRAHVRAFKDAMVRHPARLPGNLKEMTVPQILETVGDDPNVPRLAAKTINEKLLGGLNAVLNWAVNNGYRDDNPARGIRVVTGKTTPDTVLPYDIDELNRLFQMPIFTKGERPRGGAGEAANWLPLLALFTGARLEELGQLTTSDVKERDGIPYLDMLVIQDGKTRKSASSKREVPIHPELIRLGFLEYVQAQRDGGQKRLYPDLQSADDKVTAAFSKWWGRYARRYVPDRRKRFHSFRHTVKDAFKEAGVEESKADRIQGHAPASVGGRYGSGYSLKVLADAMSKLHYPGLDLHHLRKVII